MIYGAMLAGGSGTRDKSSKIPKQFIEIGGTLSQMITEFMMTMLSLSTMP